MNFWCLLKTWLQLLKYFHVSIAWGFLYPFCGGSILCEKVFLTFRHTVFYRGDVLISNHIVTFTRNFVIYMKILLFFWMLSNIEVRSSCWHESDRDVLHGMHSPLVIFCLTFKWFWLWLIVFVSMTCLNDLFLRKDMISVALNTFPNLLLLFNICQCLLIIYLIFIKVGLYVTENGIVFFHTALVLFNRFDYSRLSTFLIWFQMMFSLYPFSTNRLTKSFECFLYSSKVQQIRFILNTFDCKEYSFLVKEDVVFIN